MTVSATVHFVVVGARSDREVTAYLYRPATLVATGVTEQGKPQHVIAVQGFGATYEEARLAATSTAEQQRDRFASGLIFGGEITEERPVLDLPEAVEGEIVEPEPVRGKEVALLSILAQDVRVGDEIANVGQVIARSEIGAFIALKVNGQAVSLADGKIGQGNKDVVVHSHDDVVIYG